MNTEQTTTRERGPFPELERLPDIMYCGQLGDDAYATAEVNGSPGFVAFISIEDHARSTLSVKLKGVDPVRLTRREVLELCDLVYLIDPDSGEYVSFSISDNPEGDNS